MKITPKELKKTANISSSHRHAFKEFITLTFSALILLVTLFYLTGFLVDWIVSGISFETEAKIFQSLPLPKLKSNSLQSQSQLKKIEKIFEKLKTSPKIPPLPYRLVVLDEKEPNAFAFPGGTLGITTGLLDLLQNEIEIAFVLGHELGHFYHRDHLAGLGRALGFRIVLAVLLNGGFGDDSLSNLLNLVMERGYSQDREKSADRFGLSVVYEVYGETQGTAKLFEILKDKHQVPGWAYMLSTHPDPKKRIADLERYAKELKHK